MAAAITSGALKLTRDMLLENIEACPEKRTYFATLDSSDKDFRTFLILDRYCDEF